MKFILIGLVLCSVLGSAGLNAKTSYRPSKESPPMPPREFRAAWLTVIHHIDWPSQSGLSAAAQRTEMTRILDRMAALNMNAVIFQVRPHGDAVYRSSHEPWSHWLSGKMGQSPGYDPLAFCIQEAHKRGLEVHAWFNPFRALSNASHAASSDHVTRAAPAITKRYAGQIWMDPAEAETRRRALTAILDVVKRYDVDGVHLDDYFYPYPKNGQVFPDGRTPAERRRIVNGFVHDLYRQVKAAKPWIRVGISPFGIWQPGVPDGIEAGLDAYNDLAADARHWLKNGWVDYLAPQLYWRDQPAKQSFSALLAWWRQQGTRPVWPGIATSRIKSSDDPGRPASEITRQVVLSRTVGPQNYVGHIHWSVSGLMQNRDGVATALSRRAYAEPALVPPMPWQNKQAVAAPSANVHASGKQLEIDWKAGNAKAIFVMGRFGKTWHALANLPGQRGRAKISLGQRGHPDAVSISAVNRYGTLSPPRVMAK